MRRAVFLLTPAFRRRRTIRYSFGVVLAESPNPVEVRPANGSSKSSLPLDDRNAGLVTPDGAPAEGAKTELASGVAPADENRGVVATGNSCGASSFRPLNGIDRGPNDGAENGLAGSASTSERRDGGVGTGRGASKEKLAAALG